MHSDTIEGAPGTVSQVRGCAFELIRYAKESGTALVLVGHVTKDGTIAGPRVLEHMVDVVMSFEGERSHQYRILRALKNRFGAVDEIGVFAMAGQGLEEVANPSSLFLSGREAADCRQCGVPRAGGHPAGARRSPGADRPAAIGRHAAPRRGGLGYRPPRDVAGGARSALRAQFLLRRSLSQCRRAAIACPIPAADLAVAAALVSALADKPLPLRSTWFGEVSLAGEDSARGACRAPPARSGQARLRCGVRTGETSVPCLKRCAMKRSIDCPSSLTG